MRYFATAVIVLWQLFSLFPSRHLDQCLQICVFGELLTKNHLRRNWYNPCHTIHAMLFVSVQFWSCDILNQWEKNDYKVSINEISSLVLWLLHQSEMNKNFSLGNGKWDTHNAVWRWSCKPLQPIGTKPYESFTKHPLKFSFDNWKTVSTKTKNCNPWKKAADILIVFHGNNTVFRMDVTAWMNKGMWMYKFVYCT